MIFKIYIHKGLTPVFSCFENWGSEYWSKNHLNRYPKVLNEGCPSDTRQPPVIPVHPGSIPRFNQAYTSTTRYIFHTRPSTSFPHVKQNSMADTSRQHWVYFKVLTASYLLLLHLYNIYIYGIMEPLWSGSAVTTCDLIISAALVQLQQSIQFWFVQSLCQEAH